MLFDMWLKFLTSLGRRACRTVHFDYYFQPNREARFTSLGFNRVMIRNAYFISIIHVVALEFKKTSILKRVHGLAHLNRVHGYNTAAG